MKIGLFGGTFNPIHIGHLALAENVTDSFSLDRMIFVPSKVPPHKTDGVIEPELRLKMVQLVAAGLGDRFIVSDFEIHEEGVSYTLKTLQHFRDAYCDDAIFFACGTDIFASIGSWYEYEALFDYVNFIVVSRSTMSFEELLKTIPPKLLERVVQADEYNNEISGRIILYRMPEVDISSTEIRSILEESYRRANLPDGVYEYIAENRLYRGNE
ncbi:nicotinate-nucleotide adenylyltransferase [Seleniivibrio woodruffii]|uniref:Probable nicotinate-nucleotide adenylyltransferase n=1 Tax=Seleniivibrio woodruffii TaxID=1078050 RepID=A0A4R1KGX9_9BACT|nr:nicotinate-nucleotide adenylyltransferase [Seleniivibrio woodruffii]TCK62609.1 nicotinate-nucleotide adenylyltransferase [Seleniivibrio woodruffii]TVZ36965.1 nicotinate-nucleotide adenylyltransferase [Seleniivibrio woodruffii]